MRLAPVSRRWKNLLSHVKLLTKKREQDACPWTLNPATSAYRYDDYLVNSSESSASLGDLCARLGEQLPIGIVKLVARDTLKALVILHDAYNVAHKNITRDCLRMSSANLDALAALYSSDSATETTCFSDGEATLDYQYSNNPNVLSDLSQNTTSFFQLCITRSEQPCNNPFTDLYAIRPPEVVLDAPSDKSVDIWSLGCVLYEILTGESLFDPFFQTVEFGLTPEESHLIQMIEMLGDFPPDLVLNGKNSYRWFTPHGYLRLDTELYPVSLQKMLRLRIDASEVPLATDFLSRLLRLRPRDREKASDLLGHPWLN